MKCRTLAAKLLAIADAEGDLHVVDYNAGLDFIVRVESDLLTINTDRPNTIGGGIDPTKSQQRVAVLSC